MKIIISPAKKMRVDTDFAECSRPIFLKETQKLLAILQNMGFAELQKLWQCNEKIARTNFSRLQKTDLTRNVTPAVLAYDGLQYAHLGASVLDEKAWAYISKNLYILSGFYGILKALDGVVPYRLEMQARLAGEGFKNLYAFWGDKIYRELIKDDKIILNLASQEYSKAVIPYADNDVRIVECVFASGDSLNYKVKATLAKMARGNMVRWCAENNITDVEDVRHFNADGFSFSPECSRENVYVFLQR